MSILDKLTGFLTGGIGSQIAEIINKRVPDRDLATKLQHEIQVMLGTQQHELAKIAAETERTIIAGQIEVNKIEAESDSLFKSGWRPAVGWVCVSGLLYQLLLQPLLEWLSTIYAWMPPPTLAMDTLLTLLFGILGLGAYRTYEKTRG